MSDLKIMNAVITKATLGFGDRGFLDAWILMDHECGFQWFGGYSLYLPKSFTHHRLESAAGHFIFRVMEIAGVEEWSKLPGRTLRIKGTHSGIQAIGHIVKDDWFTPSEDFKELT